MSDDGPIEPASDRYLGLTTGSWMRLALLAILAVAIAAKLLGPEEPPGPSAGVQASSRPDAWQGRVNYVLVCRSAAAGPDGTLNVTGVLNVLELATIPAAVDLDVVVSLKPDRPGRRYELGKIHPGAAEGTRRGQSQPLSVLDAVEASGGSVTIVKQLRGLPIDHAGELRLLVVADGQVIAERVIVVRPTPG